MVAVAFGCGTKHDAFTGNLIDPPFFGLWYFFPVKVWVPPSISYGKVKLAVSCVLQSRDQPQIQESALLRRVKNCDPATGS